MTHRLVVIGLLVLPVIGVFALEDGAERAARPLDDLLDAYYRVPSDSGVTSLLEDTAQLQKLLLLMPERIERPQRHSVPLADVPRIGAEDTGGDEQAQLPGPGAEERRPEWPSVVGEPVVDESVLAWLHYRAGNYEQSAAFYRAALEQDDDDQHARFMLALCLHNTGAPEAVRDLRNALPADSDAREWAGWVLEIDRMLESPVVETNTAGINATVGE